MTDDELRALIRSQRKPLEHEKQSPAPGLGEMADRMKPYAQQAGRMAIKGLTEPVKYMIDGPNTLGNLAILGANELGWGRLDSLPMGEDYQNALLRYLGIPPEPANAVEEYATLGMSGLTGNAGMAALAKILAKGR